MIEYEDFITDLNIIIRKIHLDDIKAVIFLAIVYGKYKANCNKTSNIVSVTSIRPSEPDPALSSVIVQDTILMDALIHSDTNGQ